MYYDLKCKANPLKSGEHQHHSLLLLQFLCISNLSMCTIYLCIPLYTSYCHEQRGNAPWSAQRRDVTLNSKPRIWIHLHPQLG